METLTCRNCHMQLKDNADSFCSQICADLWREERDYVIERAVRN